MKCRCEDTVYSHSINSEAAVWDVYVCLNCNRESLRFGKVGSESPLEPEDATPRELTFASAV